MPANTVCEALNVPLISLHGTYLCREPGRLILLRTPKESAGLPASHVPFSNACAMLQCMCHSPTHVPFSNACAIPAATRLAHVLMIDVRRPHVLPSCKDPRRRSQIGMSWNRVWGLQIPQAKDWPDCQHGQWAHMTQALSALHVLRASSNAWQQRNGFLCQALTVTYSRHTASYTCTAVTSKIYLSITFTNACIDTLDRICPHCMSPV